MKSEAATPAAYIASLTGDRRKPMTEVRRVVRAHVPKGFAEVMSFGMSAWVVPLATYPDRYNGQPLVYAAFASQKNYMSLYLMCIYTGATAKRRFARVGAKCAAWTLIAVRVQRARRDLAADGDDSANRRSGDGDEGSPHADA